MGGERWEWSELHQDYFRYELRKQPGKSKYDLIWGRSLIDPPNGGSTRSEISTSDTGSTYTPTSPSPSLPRQPVDDSSVVPRLGPPLVAPPTEPNLREGHNGNTPDIRLPPLRGPDNNFRAETPAIPIERQIPPPNDFDPIQDTNYLASDAGYVVIQNPRGFYKKGKVFKIKWPEPHGEAITAIANTSAITTEKQESIFPVINSPSSAASDTTLVSEAATSTKVLTGAVKPPVTDQLNAITKSMHIKDRTFVVVRPKAKHALCLPVYTYTQQATSKPSVNAEDHAPIVLEGSDVVYHPQEQRNKLKPTISVIIEDTSIQWSPLSRINFTKIQTVEYNLRVRKVGRVSPESLQDLENLFREGIGLADE